MGLSDKVEEQLEDLIKVPHSEKPDTEVTSMVKLSIRRRFSSPEWIMAFEYPSPDGKRADAIAYNTLASRNYKIVGFEFKASRQDWLNEKRNGEKADYFVRVCDEWYVVAGRKGIIKESELPKGWGLMELKPNSGQIWKLQDSELTEYQQGIEPDRRFFSKLMEVAVGGESNYTQSDLREAKRRGYQEAIDDNVEQKSGYELEKLQEKAESWDKLQNEVNFLPWRNLTDDRIKKMELAYNLIQKMDSRGRMISSLKSMERSVDSQYERFKDNVEDVKEEIEELHEFLKGDKNL